MIDTHTADGLKVAREYRGGRRADDRARDRPAGEVRRHHRRGAGPRARPARRAGGHRSTCPSASRRCRPMPNAVKRFIAAAPDAMKVVGFCGCSGSGKTTLIEQLIPAPAGGGPARLGGQARAPRFRHRPPRQGLLAPPPGRGLRDGRGVRAGDWPSCASTRSRPRPRVHQMLAELSVCDWALVEGFKHADLPKIEVWRAETGQPVQYPDGPVHRGHRDGRSRRACPNPPVCRSSTSTTLQAVADFLLDDPAPL